jgi:hypothetical protein
LRDDPESNLRFAKRQWIVHDAGQLVNSATGIGGPMRSNQCRVHAIRDTSRCALDRRECVHHIHDNLSRRITVDELAAIACLSVFR